MSDWINKHEGSAAAMNTAIQSKVDKEEGKSLISDLEIARLADVENYDDTKVKNDIAINRTTLGTQCKNMLKLSHPFGYKYTNADGTATWTFNNDYSVSMVVNSQISSGVAIPISEVTLKKGSYIYSVEGYSTPNITHTQLYSLNADGSWTWLANLSAIENKITVTEEITYSFRAYRNNLVTVGVTETLYPMLRYADITDSTFEPYQPSVQEQTPYSLSVSGESTSAAISYSGVPTLICLTPNTADSTTGGLYIINSAGAVIKLIEKSGVVIATNTANNTFTITNNTTTVMDVCISRCWGR